MAIGSPGGDQQLSPQLLKQFLTLLIIKCQSRRLFLTPRIYSGGYPTVRWEPGIDQNTRLELMAKGHVLEEVPQNIGNVQAVIFDYENGKMYGGEPMIQEKEQCLV
ncbi:hypothetical protein GCM10020331_025470 [Ectobacillus funiculus]